MFTIQVICPADVRKVIKSLPNKASFGSDEISYCLLKEAGPGVIGPLTTLFNLSLHSSRVPDEWKEAIVFPIFKGGRKARQDPTNYRQISLRPAGSDPEVVCQKNSFLKISVSLGGFGPSVAHGKHSVRRRCVQATKNKAETCSLLDAIGRLSCGR